MTNLDYLRKASVEDVAIELVCNPFQSAVAAKEWLLSERKTFPNYTNEQILELKVSHSYELITVKELLKKILLQFIKEGENFSSKRPFGDSDWDGELIILFVNNGIISGKIDKYGFIQEYDEKQFNIKLQELVQEL